MDKNIFESQSPYIEKEERISFMKINRYQFDSIASKTKQTITPIRRGEEDGVYFEYLALLEICLYRFHLKYGLNGRQAKEILQVVLFDIKSITDHQEYDYTKWMEQCYRSCADTIEELFIPEKNPDLKKALKEGVMENDDFFEFARKNVIRIYESVTQWTKDFGPEGYFNFIRRYIETEIQSSKKYLVEDHFLKI